MDKKSDMFLFSGIPWLYSSEKWEGGKKYLLIVVLVSIFLLTILLAV